MRTLALDQASNCSGWAIFNDNELEKYGKIDLSKEPELGERLHQLRCKVKKMIKEYNIDKVILEDIYMDGQRVNNVKTFKVLAEVFGVLFELCIDLEIPVDAVLAGTWKSALGIRGKTRTEQKRAAAGWVQAHYDLKVTQDIADAICIGAHLFAKNPNEWDD